MAVAVANEIPRLERAVHHGNFEDVSREVGELLELLPLADPQRLELRLVRANAWRRSGRQHEAEAELAGLASQLATDGPRSLELRGRLEQAKLQFQQGFGEPAAVAAEAIAAECKASGFTQTFGDAQHLLGLICSLAGRQPEAQSHFEHAMAAFEAGSDDYRLAEGQAMLGMMLVRQGRSFEGIQLWRKALAYHESEGNRNAVASGLLRIGYAAWCDADLEQTHRTLSRVLEIGAETPGVIEPHVTLMATYNLAMVEFLERRLPQAKQQLGAAEQLALQLEDRTLQRAILRSRASLALMEGRVSEAVACHEAAARLAGGNQADDEIWSHMNSALL